MYFDSYIDKEKGVTVIILEKSPDKELSAKLIDFVKTRRGVFVTQDYSEFYLPKLINEKQLQKLFDFLSIDLYERGLKQTNLNTTDTDTKKQFSNSIKEKDLNLEYITFGKYKGQHISNIPLPYLKWLIDNHPFKDLIKSCKLEIQKRTTVTIHI